MWRREGNRRRDLENPEGIRGKSCVEIYREFRAHLPAAPAFGYLGRRKVLPKRAAPLLDSPLLECCMMRRIAVAGGLFLVAKRRLGSETWRQRSGSAETEGFLSEAEARGDVESYRGAESHASPTHIYRCHMAPVGVPRPPTAPLRGFNLEKNPLWSTRDGEEVREGWGGDGEEAREG